VSKFDSSNRSDMKPIILEAIDLQSPLPTSDLEEYVRASVGHAYPTERGFKTALGLALNRLSESGLIAVKHGRWSRVQARKADHAAVDVPVVSQTDKTQLPSFQRGRVGRTVMVERAVEFIDVYGVQLQYNGQLFSMPMASPRMRVIIGDMPAIDPDQESYRDIRKVVITMKSGEQVLFDVRDHEYVTIVMEQTQ
jgi:hypothetical protein